MPFGLYPSDSDEPESEEFRLIASEGDSKALQPVRRDERPASACRSACIQATARTDDACSRRRESTQRVFLVVRYDGQVSVDPTLPDPARPLLTKHAADVVVAGFDAEPAEG